MSSRNLPNRSVDWWVMSEDLPDPDNRVSLTTDGAIRLRWRPNNIESHRRLVARATEIMREAGYDTILTQSIGIETTSHQCGTLRMGDDPATSVLDPYCRSHDVANLYVVDTSFFPSSAAINPALTLAAQALRVAEHLQNL